MIALVTDSASQIPPGLAADFGVRVAPIIVNIDGVEYREGVDLTADDFWSQVSNGEVPEITTSQPSPGTFSEIYQSAVETRRNRHRFCPYRRRTLRNDQQRADSGTNSRCRCSCC